MKFIYYFDGVRYTETDIDFLRELSKDCENQKEVINGILESERRFNEEQSNNG